MSKKAGQRRASVSESNGNGRVTNERAESDGTWRSRPQWRAKWMDGTYGPQLTLAARQLLVEERKHADSGN